MSEFSPQKTVLPGLSVKTENLETIVSFYGYLNDKFKAQFDKQVKEAIDNAGGKKIKFVMAGVTDFNFNGKEWLFAIRSYARSKNQRITAVGITDKIRNLLVGAGFHDPANFA